MKACAVQFPVPESERTGWPWTESYQLMPAVRADGKAWPKISIVMPSFNQAGYLEEAIRSVLLQGYPNLEFFIIDGGSNDESVRIIQKYELWLAGWISEADRGQSHAINKGFRRCTGEIFNWLCSDDVFRPGAFHVVADRFIEEPESDVVVGKCFCQFDDRPEWNRIESHKRTQFEAIPYSATIWQPSCFFRRTLVARPELVELDLHYCMDRELWCYLQSTGAKWTWIEETLSVCRFTGLNKSLVGGSKILHELDRIYRAYTDDLIPLTFWLSKLWLPLAGRVRNHRSKVTRNCSRILSRPISLGLRGVYGENLVRVMQAEFLKYGAPWQ